MSPVRRGSAQPVRYYTILESEESTMKIALPNDIKAYQARIQAILDVKGKERNRFIVIFLSSLFLLDYLMFSYHTDKNIFDIFPSIPVIEDKVDISIYIPSLDGASVLKEKRSVPRFGSSERYAKFLIAQVMKGSMYENTMQAVPMDLFVRHVWIAGDAGKSVCVIDIVPSFVEENMKIISGTESLFKDAVAKTLKENIPGIENVTILVRGIPGKTLWEL